MSTNLLRVTDRARKQIRTRRLIKLLLDDAMGVEGAELNAGRRKSIEILLKKSVPDLAVQAITDGEGNGTHVALNFNFTAKKPVGLTIENETGKVEDD